MICIPRGTVKNNCRKRGNQRELIKSNRETSTKNSCSPPSKNRLIKLPKNNDALGVLNMQIADISALPALIVLAAACR